MGREVALSARMLALVHMVTAGNRVCDVGCDHGFVSIYLVQQGISPRVLAMDVRQGPLSRAREHIRQQGLEAYIETRLSDGVSALGAGEADTVICAGMGGRLMQRILEEGREKLETVRELILQPQSDIPAFRAYLWQAGYVLLAEDMVYEDGKYYPMMKVTAGKRRPPGTEEPGPESSPGSHLDGGNRERQKPGEGSEAAGVSWKREAERPAQAGRGVSPDGEARCISTEAGDGQALQDRFGELLLAGSHPVLRQYLLYEQQGNRRILEQLQQNAAGSRAARRIRELEEEQRLIGLALKQMELPEHCGTKTERGSEDEDRSIGAGEGISPGNHL
ncbi:MAG: SAM-dependent methyltransferase [Lachnospiraceae bacterium]|nr:SAM-dependent methyltransferase [Lachnospiraceae bacterium]